MVLASAVRPHRRPGASGARPLPQPEQVLLWRLDDLLPRHIVSGNDVAMDLAKVEAVRSWPTPNTVRALRGFLGLTGYYCKFIKDYGVVARPLTQLLKREAFLWTPDADVAFTALKDALTSGPTLQLPDFDKAIHRQLRRFWERLRRSTTPGRWPDRVLQSARRTAACQIGGLRVRAHWPRQGGAPLATLSLGPVVHRPHRPLLPEIPTGSTFVNHSAAHLGKQAFWL
jgi:hypothetical protein